MLEFCFREKYNAVNTPAQTMQSAPSIAYFVSIPAVSSAVISIIFLPCPTNNYAMKLIKDDLEIWKCYRLENKKEESLMW